MMGKIKKTLNVSKNLLDQNEDSRNLSHDLVILLLLYTLENKNWCPCVSVVTLHIAPLVIMAKVGKNRYPTWQTHKQMLQPHTRTPPSCLQGISVTHALTDEPGKHDTKWKKPITKAIYCIILVMWNVQNKQICRKRKLPVVVRG